jgi:hypothetical protein
MKPRLSHPILSRRTLELIRREACENDNARLALTVAFAERSDIDPSWAGLTLDAIEAAERLINIARRKIRKLRQDSERGNDVDDGSIKAYASEVSEELQLAVRVLDELSEACESHTMEKAVVQ